MINVYEFENYRDLFQSIFKDSKLKSPNKSLAQIAKDCGIQPSYLTNVLKSRAHFNTDQAVEILYSLGYAGESVDYVLLLIELDRSGSLKHQKILSEKIYRIRQLKLRADQYLEIQKSESETHDGLTFYYLDPLVPILHMYFGIKNADQSPQKIALKLRVPELRVQQIIDYLKAQGLIIFKSGKLKLGTQLMHLPKDSPLIKAHQTLIRNLTLERMSRLNSENHYSFSVTFNADESTRTQIQVDFLKFIKRAQNLCKGSKSENVMQMNFDLFSWDL